MSRAHSLYLLAGLVSLLFTVLVCFPARWLAPWLEQASQGRLTLGEAEGTLWQGSAFLAAAEAADAAWTPLFAGRFSWTVSPRILLGQLEIQLSNPASFSAPLRISNQGRTITVAPGTVRLAASRLTALGAPFNTLKPEGELSLSWQPLQLTWRDGRISGLGQLTLALDEMASRLSPVRPLGDYRVLLDWQGERAGLALHTVHGPMLLAGQGNVAQGRVQFSGTARAEAGQDGRLDNFLNLLGRSWYDHGQLIIALEFK